MTTTQLRTRQETPPSGLAAAPAAGGGTFTAGAKYWKITAQTPLGESAASAEATATVAASGQATLTWDPLPPGHHHVTVYRGTAPGAEDRRLVTIPGRPTGWTDTGAAGAAGTPPAPPAWSNVAKTPGGQAAKSNMPAGLPPGFALQLYAALVGWGSTGNTAAQARYREHLLSVGYDVQEA